MPSTRDRSRLLLASVLLTSTVAAGIAAGQSPPAAEWFASYNGSREESHGHYILECEDGGFLQIGETGFVGANARILVVKTDATGERLWQKEFGSGSRNMGNSALEVEDGYLVCGMLNRNSAILKLDKTTGATIFQKSHDNGGADAFENIAATGKAFGEGTEHHVDVRQGIDIQTGADGVVGDHRDVALVCELADRGKVDTAQ